ESASGTDASTDEAPDPAGKEPKEGASSANEPEPDPVNDPIPDDIKGRTRERMQGLITSVKDTATERDKYKAERDEILAAIADTGASPELFGDTMAFLKHLHSNSP